MNTEKALEVEVAHLSISEWGAVMKLARASSMLALEDAKRKKLISNPVDASIMLFTDDPCTAGALHTCGYMEDILGVSQIERVAIVSGDKFPEASFEAQREDLEMPRIAAMFFHASGLKCPRCRKKYDVLTEDGICQRCDDVVNPKPAAKPTLWQKLKTLVSAGLHKLKGRKVHDDGRGRYRITLE